MIVLWIISLLIVAVSCLVVFSAPTKEDQGCVKWIVLSQILIVLFTLIWMGVRIWLKN